MGQTESLLDERDVEEDLKEEKKEKEDLPLRIDYFIPDDIFFTVFTFLGFGDVRSIKLCSKRFYYLANLARNSFKFNGSSAAHPKVIKEIVEVLTKEDISQRYRTIDLGLLHLEAADLNIVTEKCRNLRKLFLRKCVKIDDEALSYIVKNCEYLKELDLVGVQNVTRKGLKELSALKLEYFAISSFRRTSEDITKSKKSQIVERYEGKDQPVCCEGNKRKYFFYEFFAHGNQGKDLKRLYIDSNETNITHFSSLYNLIDCTEDDLFKYFPRCGGGNYEKLESLELFGYNNQNNDAEHLSVLFPNIQRFELWKGRSNYYRYNNPTLNIKLLEHINEKINILRIPTLQTDEQLRFLEKFNDLKSLRIEGEPGIMSDTRFSFEALRGCAKTLRFLEVTTSICSFPIPNDNQGKQFSPGRGIDLSFYGIHEFEGLEKLIFSFQRLSLQEFNHSVVPYLVKQGPRLRHLEIFLPRILTKDDKSWNFSFIGTLENCSILGLKGIQGSIGSEQAVKDIISEQNQSLLRKKLKSIDLSGMVGAKKWMVNKILHGFYKSALEELVMFGVDGLESYQFNHLRKKYSIRLYITKP